MQDKGHKYVKDIDKMREEMGWSREEFLGMGRDELEARMKEKDEEIWKIELQTKSSLKIYREILHTTRNDDYDNTNESKLLFRVRTNTLPLKERLKDDDRKCTHCGKTEDLEHFLTECKRYDNTRHQILKGDKPNDTKMVDFLKLSTNTIKFTITKMWKQRK